MSLLTRDAADFPSLSEVESLVEINLLATYLGLAVATLLVYDTGEWSV